MAQGKALTPSPDARPGPRARRAQICRPLASGRGGPYAWGVVILRSLTALTVALFMMGVGVQSTLLLCRSKKTTHHSCCCKHTVDPSARGVELSSAPCCDATTADSLAAPPSSGAAPAFSPAAPILLPDLHASLAPALPGTLVPRAALEGPHRATGPPLHLKHRALLI